MATVPRGAAARIQALGWSRRAVAGLGLVLGIEAVWLIALAVVPLPTVPVPARPSSREAAEPMSRSVPEFPSLAESATRPLFSGATPQAGAMSSAIPSGSARLLASRLTLMGIVAGEPAQAIIEDSQTKKTYFVTPGQPVAEGAILERVLDNSVVLNYLGEKIELTL